MNLLVLLAECALKATILFGLAAAGAYACRRRSAALRHALWCAAVVGSLLLPAMHSLRAWWPETTRPSERTTSSAARVGLPATYLTVSANLPPVAGSRSFLLVGLWAAGALWVAGRFALGATHAAALARRARPWRADTSVPVPVRISNEVGMPLTTGLLRPIILLPVGAAAWPAERLRLVLLHESAHARRLDTLTQAFAHAATAFYWFHPLAWLAAARLRVEREIACDDLVVTTTRSSAAYADHLLAIARAACGQPAAPPVTLAMARMSELEGRLTMILNPLADRRPLSRRTPALAAFALAAVLLPLSAMQAVSGSKIAGEVRDLAGVVPNARVTLLGEDGAVAQAGHTDPSGRYSFVNLNAGRYRILIERDGSAAHMMEIEVPANQQVGTKHVLRAGNLREAMPVPAERPGQSGVEPSSVATATSDADAGAPKRIRVGGNVMGTKVVNKVRPATQRRRSGRAFRARWLCRPSSAGRARCSASPPSPPPTTASRAPRWRQCGSGSTSPRC